MFKVNIYIETTVKGPAKRNGTYGSVLEYKGQTIHTREKFGELQETTHNQSTLTALLDAISLLNNPCNIEVFTDNKYIASVFESNWLLEWTTNNWKTAKGQDVKDKELWQKLNIYVILHSIKITVTKNHEYSDWMNAEMKRRESHERATIPQTDN